MYQMMILLDVGQKLLSKLMYVKIIFMEQLREFHFENLNFAKDCQNQLLKNRDKSNLLGYCGKWEYLAVNQINTIRDFNFDNN